MLHQVLIVCPPLRDKLLNTRSLRFNLSKFSISMNNSVIELSQRLVQALDKNYNVIDMATVLFVIESLEDATVIVTKELLELTRLGKTVNELRKKISSQKLARRAKELLKRWRTDITLPDRHSQVNGATNNVHNQAMKNPMLNNHKDASKYLSNNHVPNIVNTHAVPVPVPSQMQDSRSQNAMDAKHIKRVVDPLLIQNDRSCSPHPNLKRKEISPDISQLPAKRPRRNGVIDRTTEVHTNTITHSQSNAKIGITPEKEKRHKKHKKEKKSKKHKIGNEVLSVHNSVDNCPPMSNHYTVPDLAQKPEVNFSEQFERERHAAELSKSKFIAADTVHSLPDSRSTSPGIEFSQNSNGSSSNICTNQSNIIPIVPAVKPEPKKRGRKKGSKANQTQDKQQNLISDLKKRIETMSGKSKIKTTAEIVADLQNRSDKRQSGTFVIPEETTKIYKEEIAPTITNDCDISTKIGNHLDYKSQLSNIKDPPIIRDEHVSNTQSIIKHPIPIKSGFVDNTSGVSKEIKSEEDEEFIDVVVDIPEKAEPVITPVVESVTPHQKFETVEEILSRLPKLDRDSIDWEDHDVPCSCIEKLPEPDENFRISELIQPALKKSIFDVDYEEEPAVVVQTESVPQVATYIIDPDCPAKMRYVDNTKLICQYHLEALHNKCIADVNGTWHEGPARSKCTESDIYENVVPNYSHLVQETIQKDFSSIKFSRFRRAKCKNGVSYSRLKHCAKTTISTSESDDEQMRGTKQIISDRNCCSSCSSGCEHDLNEIEQSEVKLDKYSSDHVDPVVSFMEEQVCSPHHKNCDLVHTNIQFSERNPSLEIDDEADGEDDDYVMKSPMSDRSHLSSQDDNTSVKSPREGCNSSGYHESEDVPSNNEELAVDPTCELPTEDNGRLKSFVSLSNESSSNKEANFREWFEVVQRTSFNDELLTILPYVVID